MHKVLWYIAFTYLNVLFAQDGLKQISFRELTVENGLSQNSVVSIAQDSIGFMWFATQDGLNKYDGRSFTIYNKQFEDVTRPSFSKLGKIYVDRTGQLYIITDSSHLEVFDQDADAFKPITNVSNVNLIFQDKDFTTYIGTFNHGLFKINSVKKDTIQVFKNSDSKSTVYDIVDSGNELLIAASGSVFSLKNNEYSEINVANNSHTNFSALAKTKGDHIWLGSFGDGLYFKSSGNKGFEKYRSLPKNLNIQDILVDKNDRTWIATYGQGVYLIDSDKETIQHFTANKNNPYALHYNDVLNIYEDYTGTIWLGTDGAGLSYYDEHLAKFNVLTNNQLPSAVNVDVIRSIVVKDDDIWLGTSGKGLTKINLKNQDFKTYVMANSDISSNRIMSLLHEGEQIWIGHQGKGLDVLLKNGKFKTFRSLSKMTIWKIVKASDESLWLATRDGGLLLFNEKKGVLKQFNAANSSLSSNNIRTLERDGENQLWIGTDDEGLFKLNTQTDNLERIGGIPDKIKSLLLLDNILWIGTNGNGLKSYDTKNNSIVQYTTDEGLSNNVIYGILKGQDNELWLSSNKGITQFNIKNQNQPSITNYGNYDGLQAFEFNTGAYFKGENGNLYFGGLEGLNWFNPKRLTFNSTRPKTIISRMEVFNKEEPLFQNKKFKHNENTITFTFSGLHFSQPERNEYRYKLINNDADWIEAGNNNVAHYTNLPPNDYEFLVLSSNYDGVWDTSPASYKFSVLKPWYASNIALLSYVILLAFLVLMFYRYLKFRWEVKTQLQLEHAETERLKKLDEFKTKLYTNISHEFRTPLTLISGPIDKQLTNQSLAKEDKKELQLVKQNAMRLLGLVNQMMDLSLIDAGQIKLKVEKGNLKVILKQIVSAFQYKANEKKITIEPSIHQLENCWFDKDIVEKIASNLLSNAIKYAPKASTVSFNAQEQNNQLLLSVINQNNQVKVDKLGKLFERFYQNNEASEGIGVGLALVKDLVALSKGTILANTLENNKIQFNVTLPISKDSFEDFELVEQAEEFIPDYKKSFSEKHEHSLVIVDDEQDILNFVATIFNDNYNVFKTTNAKIALKYIREHLPDLVISDVMMPGTNGIELCNQLKSDRLTSHIPIVLLTAKVTEEQQQEGLETGADAYVTKPFNTDILKVRVEQLIKIRAQLKEHFNKNPILTKALEVTSVEAEFMQRLKEVLDAHLINPEFTADAFSQQMVMSRTQLHRKLKAIVGMSTSEFIRSQRLLLARDALKKENISISEIAYMVGFNSVSYFIKCFKDVYNVTPSQFLNQKNR